jgi:hypothetical protein
MNGYLDALARLSHLAFGHTVSKEFWSRLRTSLYRRVHGDAGHGETGGQSEGDEEGLGRHELRSSAPMRNGEVESCVVETWGWGASLSRHRCPGVRASSSCALTAAAWAASVSCAAGAVSCLRSGWGWFDRWGEVPGLICR